MSQKTHIELPVHGIRLVLSPEGSGTIVSEPMYETCPKCNKPSCLYQKDATGRLGFNGAIDGIMSMILAHACAGIDIKSPAYMEGIETAIQSAGENL